MATTPAPPFMAEIFDILASTPTPQDILAYQPSEALVARSYDVMAYARSG